MSKCNRCKYEYSSKLDEPCKYCREQMGELSLAYQMHDDKFQPKEEQSTIEHNGCMGCVYEDFEELEEPCVNCKGTEQDNGEYCSQSTDGYDSYWGHYYYPLDNGKYLKVYYEC